MKNNKRHIIHSWILLLCFIAGQYMVYAHQHKLIQGLKQTYAVNKHQAAHHTISEKCKLCDAMHHYSTVNSTHAMPVLLPVEDIAYVSPVYTFVSFSLILAGGRAPPIAG